MADLVKIAENKVLSTIVDKGNKYLTFELNEEEYGLEILKVQEIIGMMNVTHVPRMPEYVKGVINLRGKIIPIIDLRMKFEMQAQEYNERTCIVEVQVQNHGQNVIMGVIVDRVSEVLDIADKQIEETPAFGANVNTEFITGMGKVGQRVVMLLDIDKVFSYDEMEIVRKTKEPT
ncbi:MAG: chemotaxis protein CheW [Candidatus Margulisiibacteriota bacterium]|nr:MAG: chemotaxis protein CheW [Candidatus Margulisbacteria bacterium GWD2_39_127]PZM81871.1 MAG: chemotaxis protein CheW [Candidatus Margulisiibacteriota bacterium]HAR63088.1 chemotaxis protein CheW [Candidatus Margulisiibacteriota bacterium]HCY38143.1 chemotaxis protein CheW [Candidatus Margulisiibacteriota bacterium]